MAERSAEHNAKIAAALRGRKQSPELREKNRLGHLGLFHSAAARKRMSESQRQRWSTATESAKKKNMLATQLPEAREKRSQTHKRQWADATTRAKRVDAIRAASTPSLSLKKSAGQTSLWASLGSAERLRRTEAMRRQAGIARPTGLEREVAAQLRALGVKYREQEPIGPYLVDFLIPDRALVVEADGHYWHTVKPGAAQKDAKRDRCLRELGFEVLRITEAEIKAGAFDALRKAVA